MLKKILIAFLSLVVVILLLIYFNVLWLLAPYYEVKNFVPIEVPIMDMDEYKQISATHRRPYHYKIETKEGGKVYIVGVDHTKNPKDPQLDTIRAIWNQFDADVALVEGRVGNLFLWLQNPVAELGEGGLVTYMANKAAIDVYTWEPPRESEIKLLQQQFPVKQIAMFYAFRPYFSNMRYGKPDNPEEKLQDYLESRTDYDGIRGLYATWEELDMVWQRDFPDYDWRNHSSGNGWPKGYLHDIWNASNNARDEYMIQIILDLVGDGKKVLVTMGSSHAPRIEQTLQFAIQKN